MQPAIQYNEITVSMGFNSIISIIKANEAAGLYFFAHKTMDFFNSRIESQVIGGCLFITSERPPKGARTAAWESRRYTIRAADPEGGVNTVGDFGEFPSKAKARRVAERLSLSLRDTRQAVHGSHRLTAPKIKV